LTLSMKTNPAPAILHHVTKMQSASSALPTYQAICINLCKSRTFPRVSSSSRSFCRTSRTPSKVVTAPSSIHQRLSKTTSTLIASKRVKVSIYECGGTHTSILMPWEPISSFYPRRKRYSPNPHGTILVIQFARIVRL